VLDHGLDPWKELLLGHRRRLGEEDLDPALVCVLGVLGSDGVAASRGEELVAVEPDQPLRCVPGGRRTTDAPARRPALGAPADLSMTIPAHPRAMILTARGHRLAEIPKLRIVRSLCTTSVPG
jgi:hypothetical protein